MEPAGENSQSANTLETAPETSTTALSTTKPAVDALQPAPSLPTFWREDPNLWFCQVDLTFASRSISSESRRFQIVASQLPYEVAVQVSGLLQQPGEKPYSSLKKQLIAIYERSREEKLIQLLEDTRLGDSKPSKLLRHMKMLAGDSASTEVVKTIWLRALPAKTRSILAAMEGQPIEKLADIADRILEVEPQVAAVQVPPSAIQCLTEQLNALRMDIDRLKQSRDNSRERHRPRPTSRGPTHSTGMCYFHNKFGNNARRCRSPCTQRRHATEQSENYRQ